MKYSKAMIKETATQTGLRSVARKEDGICIGNFEGAKLKLQKSFLQLKLVKPLLLND